MDAIQLLLLSIILYLAAALTALLLNRSGGTARVVAGSLGLLASLAGCASAVVAMLAVIPPEVSLFLIEPFGSCTIQIDKLSGFYGRVDCTGQRSHQYIFDVDGTRPGSCRIFHAPVRCIHAAGSDSGECVLLLALLGNDDPDIIFPGHLGDREERINKDRLHIYAGGACRRGLAYVSFLCDVPKNR